MRGKKKGNDLSLGTGETIFPLSSVFSRIPPGPFCTNSRRAQNRRGTVVNCTLPPPPPNREQATERKQGTGAPGEETAPERHLNNCKARSNLHPQQTQQFCGNVGCLHTGWIFDHIKEFLLFSLIEHHLKKKREQTQPPDACLGALSTNLF